MKNNAHLQQRLYHIFTAWPLRDNLTRDMPESVDPNLLSQIKQMLRRDLKLGEDRDIPDDMPLFGSNDLDLDSLDILLLVTNIEKQLGVRIPNESIGQDVFRDVATLAQYVADHRGTARKTGVSEVHVDDWLSKLPHREPFRFISRVVSVKPGESSHCLWNVRGDEPYFAGHFPGNPIVPGMLIAEALAQASGFAAPADAGPDGRLAHADVRFETAVVPPVEIELHARLLRAVGTLQVCEVEAIVAGSAVARGTITLHRPQGFARHIPK